MQIRLSYLLGLVAASTVLLLSLAVGTDTRITTASIAAGTSLVVGAAAERLGGDWDAPREARRTLLAIVTCTTAAAVAVWWLLSS